jgi:membrane-associated phospholipid phosphatase
MKQFLRNSWQALAREEAAAWNGAPPVARQGQGALPFGLEAILRSLGAFEWLSLGYLGWLNLLLAIFRRNLTHWDLYMVFHCWLALGIVCLAQAAAQSRNKIVQFARGWYPLALWLIYFEELGRLVHVIFPGWFDRWLIQFDYQIAGVHPAAWLAQFSSPALNDFMQFAYMTYFLYLVLLPAILYAEKKRFEFWRILVSTAAANYFIYVIAVLFPIESPHFSLAWLGMNALDGGALTATINFIERFGRVHGGAFPSAHVAGSMVALLAAWSYRRWLFWVYLPFFASMCVATVYGRYHYVADVLAGLVVGWIGYEFGGWLMRRRGAMPEFAE